MGASDPVLVKMFGSLHAHRVQRGLPTTTEVEVPADGITARELAVQLDLPLDKIEAVFRNRLVEPLDCAVHPGDRIAFVPRGIPGPYRYMLGIYKAGKDGGKGQE